MGAILAKFRKTKTTAEVLERLEEEIQQIEKYSLNTREQKKRFVGGFLAFSIGLFVVALCVVYFIYLPTTWTGRITYIIPMLLFPLVIILLRKLFTWYFQRKLNKNSDKLTELRAEKKKILEQVKDKETYKVAVNLLSRFGDKSSGNKFSFSNAITPRISNASATPFAGQNPQQRSLSAAAAAGGGGAGDGNQLRLNNNNLLANRTPGGMLGTPRQPTSMAQLGAAAPRQLAFSPPQQQQQQLALETRAGQELRRRTPFPIVNQQDKSVIERIVDVLIGDGPQDRFAMICKGCFAHNGMALKEEFDYTTFRCAFCNAINPARKERPVAPRLPQQHQSIAAAKDSSDTSSSSGDDSDAELNFKQQQQQQHQVPAQQRLTEITSNMDADVEADNVAAVMSTIAAVNGKLELDDIEMIESEALDAADAADINGDDDALQEQATSKTEEESLSHTPKLNDEFKKEM